MCDSAVQFVVYMKRELYFSYTGWLCLDTFCSLVTDLHSFIPATPSIVKYLLEVSISRYSCFVWINMNLESVPFILIGKGKT